MTDNAKKTSELPIVNSMSSSDRIVIVYQANTAPSTRTIAAKNLTTNLVPGPYASDSAANTAGVAINGMYYDVSGNVKIRLT